MRQPLNWSPVNVSTVQLAQQEKARPSHSQETKEPRILSKINHNITTSYSSGVTLPPPWDFIFWVTALPPWGRDLQLLLFPLSWKGNFSTWTYSCGSPKIWVLQLCVWTWGREKTPIFNLCWYSKATGRDPCCKLPPLIQPQKANSNWKTYWL